MKRLSLSFVRDVSYQIRILFLSSFLLKKTRSAIDDTPISPPPKKSIMITQPAKNSKRITKRRGGYFFFRWSNKTKMCFLYSCLYTTIRKTTNQSTASNNLKIKTVDTQNKRRVGRGKMVFFFFWRNNTTTSITSFTTCYYQTWRDILGSPPPLPYFSCSPKKPFSENMTSGLRICPLHLLNFKLFWRPTGETAERHEKLHHCQRVVKNKNKMERTL